MRKKNLVIALISFVTLLPGISLTQEWGGEKPVNFWDHWSININTGLTSYYGDLSYYDSDILGKLDYESKPAFGVMITKHINKKFGVSGQLLYGQIKGGNNNISFQTNLLEYNLQARLDFIRLIFPDRNPKFGVEGFAGFGHTWFTSDQFKLNDDEPIQNTIRTDVPEFVYFGGIGIHYHLSDRFAITSSLSLRHLQNDKLDQLVKNNDYDFYSYLSVGLTYYINSIGSKPLKNKARLAHSSRRSR